MPLTRANLQFVTGVPRGKLEKWLDQLVADGVLDVDADDDGEMVWGVRGAARATSGPQKPEEVKKLADLKQEVAGSAAAASSALALMKVGAGTARSLVAAGEGKKSLVASGLLSFFFGPLGWLYAAPLKEAVPAIVVYSLFWIVFSHFALFAPIFTLLHILFGAAGVGYALRHNQKGERTSLLTSDPGRALPPRR